LGISNDRSPTMNPTLAPLLAQLKVNDWLFRQSFKGLTAAEAARSPDGKINSPQWVAGHMAASRARAAPHATS